MSKYYFALKDFSLDWPPKQVDLVEEMWNKGNSLELISRKVKRPFREVFILIYDRLELGEIEPRKGSIFGYEPREQTKKSS